MAKLGSKTAKSGSQIASRGPKWLIWGPKWPHKDLTRPIAISRVLCEQRLTDQPTNRRTNGPTNKAAYRVACTRLKMDKKVFQMT